MIRKVLIFGYSKAIKTAKFLLEIILKLKNIIKEHFISIVITTFLILGILNFFILPAFKNEIEKRMLNLVSKNVIEKYSTGCEKEKQNNNNLSFPNDCIKVELLEEIRRDSMTIIGKEGPEGDKGKQGPRGKEGEEGDKGEKGDTGDTGPIGPTGPKGDKGDKGDEGDKGEKGDTGNTGPTGPSGPAGTLVLSYGSFFDTTTQTNPIRDIARVVTYNSSSASNGISIVNNSKIKVTRDGLYNVQFSIQIYKSDTGTDFVDFWLVKNNNPVSDTNTRMTLIGKFYYNVAAWNYLVEANSGDEFELYWSSADTSLQLITSGPFTGPVRPRIPSVILTVIQEK